MVTQSLQCAWSADSPGRFERWICFMGLRRRPGSAKNIHLRRNASNTNHPVRPVPPIRGFGSLQDPRSPGRPSRNRRGYGYRGTESSSLAHGEVDRGRTPRWPRQNISDHWVIPPLELWRRVLSEKRRPPPGQVPRTDGQQRTNSQTSISSGRPSECEPDLNFHYAVCQSCFTTVSSATASSPFSPKGPGFLP